MGLRIRDSADFQFFIAQPKMSFMEEGIIPRWGGK